MPALSRPPPLLVSGRTAIGCITPIARIEAANRSIEASSIPLRGWKRPGASESTGRRRKPGASAGGVVMGGDDAGVALAGTGVAAVAGLDGPGTDGRGCETTGFARTGAGVGLACWPWVEGGIELMEAVPSIGLISTGFESRLLRPRPSRGLSFALIDLPPCNDANEFRVKGSIHAGWPRPGTARPCEDGTRSSIACGVRRWERLTLESKSLPGGW